MKKLSASSGFTLIELLVVIAIIGVLSAVLFANFTDVQQRGRDGQRKADLRSIQHALELYRSDQGNYPSSAITCGGSITGPSGSAVYMTKVPCDPTNSGELIYQFSVSQNQYSYCLKACLERSTDPQKDSSINPSPSGCTLTANCTKASFTVQNP